MSTWAFLWKVVAFLKRIAEAFQLPAEPRVKQPPPKRHTDQDALIRRQRELHRKNHPELYRRKNKEK